MLMSGEAAPRDGGSNIALLLRPDPGRGCCSRSALNGNALCSEGVADSTGWGRVVGGMLACRSGCCWPNIWAGSWLGPLLEPSNMLSIPPWCGEFRRSGLL
jgi:hypothetical protein